MVSALAGPEGVKWDLRLAAANRGIWKASELTPTQ